MIAQEVRDFAAKQRTESYLAATAPVDAAEEGMAEMSKLYDATGRELYMGAGDREHD